MTSPSPLVVSQINVYPVKSLGGASLPAARVDRRGLRHDRRWMLVNPDGQFLTQRALPRMALIAARVDADELCLQAPFLPPLRVPFPPPASAPALDVRVWDSVCRAVLCAPEADRWLCEFLQTPCRLVWMPDSTHRPVPGAGEYGPGIVSFADAFPLLLLSEASLLDLNQRLAVPVPMDRFRPNIVVSGAAPYAEDDWRTITVGETVFHVVKPCARCSMTTVDQSTGDLDGPEPLRTLAAFRRWGQKIVFGQYLIPAAPGAISVGMRVCAQDEAAGE